MKRLLLFLICFVSLHTYAQNNYKILQKFKFHSIELLETDTDRLIEEFPDGEGLIINTIVEGEEYLLIAIPDIIDYKIRVVNSVKDAPPDGNLKVVMYQGGENVEGGGIYTANIFYVYDLTKNKDVPQRIRLEINGAPNIQQYEGIIKLD